MLALAGSDSPDSPGAGGLWRLQVQLAPDRPQQAAVEVYVARNESELGCPPRHRPARLVDPSCDPQRYLREAEADPAVAGRPRLMVLRAGTASAQVSGGAPYGVGALRLRPVERPAPYSSAGLGALSGSSLADESLNVPGLTVAGTRSASLQRMQGTSFACPQMARVAADRDSAVPGQRSRRPGPTEIRRVTGGTDRLGQVVTVPRRG
jgi:hypothetical protein